MRSAVFDTETDGLIPNLTRMWCAVVKSKEDGVRKFTPDTIDQLCDYLDSFDVLVGHNIIGFDFIALRKLFGWEFKGQAVDTLIMSRTQRPKRQKPKAYNGVPGGPHSLGVWGWRLGHAKVEHEDWSRFSPEMLHRCEEDVHINEELLEALNKEGENEGWHMCHRLNMKLFQYLAKQEEYGWLVDKPLMDQSIIDLTRWIGRIDTALIPRLPLVREVLESKVKGEYGFIRKPFKKDGTLSKSSQTFVDNYNDPEVKYKLIGGPFSRVGFRPVDLDKNSEVKEYLLNLGWIPDEWNTNNVGARTSPKMSKNDSFVGVQGSMGKLLVKRVQCKQRRGIVEGWIENIRPDGRLTTKVAGMAATGRMRHNLVVNVPGGDAFFGKRMRQMFIAAPGKVIVGADSKGNQMRQLAARMQDKEFTHAVLHGNSADGTDLHSLNQRRTGLPTRGKAKNFFYGLIFGAQAAKVGALIDGTREDGARFIAAYMDEMPGLKKLIDEETKKWKATAQRIYNPRFGRYEYKNGYITGLDGRPILVENEHTILVYILQSDESIQMAAAYVWLMVQLEKKGYKYGEDFGVLIWMHDEFQIECRPEIAEDIAETACLSIKWAGEFYKINCPHDGDAKIGDNWYETH